jgi:hypothetical protein
MNLETQRCGNCEFYDLGCKWCNKRGASHINVRTHQGKPTNEYPCNSQWLCLTDGTNCREHSCRVNGRWVIPDDIGGDICEI